MLNIFDDWASDEIKTANDVAKQTGAEELLIGRLSKISPDDRYRVLSVPTFEGAC